MFWYNRLLPLHHNKKTSTATIKTKVMKNTDFTLEFLSTLISSESFSALADMVDEMGLEIKDVDFSRSL